MNSVFLALVVVAFVVAALRDIVGSGAPVMATLSQAVLDEASRGVTLAISLIGVMALFLGLMKVAEEAGLLATVARLLRRPLQRLFPDVPSEHPAMGAMVLNIAANVLGLGNAATPFGLKAMQDLDTLNAHKGWASNPMVLFLAINTASVTILPTSVIALRAAAGSADPAGIVPTTLFATLCSTAVAIVVARLGQRLSPLPPDALRAEGSPSLAVAPATHTGNGGTTSPTDADPGSAALWESCAGAAGVVLLVALTLLYGRAVGPWLIPALVTALVVFGALRRVRVYETLVDGAGEGFRVAVRIIPYLVAILVAIGMFRASGAVDALLAPVARLGTPVGLPAEALVMAVLRSLSGSGAYAYLASIINDPAIGPDSFTGYLVSTIQGSTETTFYVLAVYCGAVGVRRMRHALLAGLIADAAGLAAAVFICRLLHPA
ncbi:MAG: nucleoside recognition domain-containing protein [Rhodospirillales bacterium]